MRKSLLVILSFLLLLNSCKSTPKTDVERETSNRKQEYFVNVLTPKEVSHDVLSILSSNNNEINFNYVNNVDFKKKSSYLIIAVKSVASIDRFFDEVSPFTGPSPSNDFGGTLNSIIQFQYYEVDELKNINYESMEREIDRLKIKGKIVKKEDKKQSKPVKHKTPKKEIVEDEVLSESEILEVNTEPEISSQNRVKDEIIEPEIAKGLNSKVRFGFANRDDSSIKDERLTEDGSTPSFYIQKEFFHKELGQLTALDKAGPFLNVKLLNENFTGSGYIRGIQIQWIVGDETIIATIDLTGEYVNLYNAKGTLSEFIKDNNGKNYEVNINFNDPADRYNVSYIEYNINNVIHYSGEFVSNDK